MIWSVYLPIVSLLIFAAWMLRISLRARASLKRVRLEVAQLTEILKTLKSNRRDGENIERWLGDTYAFVTKNSFSKNNPLVELISRFYAMRELASPDVFAALESVNEREMDKLELARETPNTLLLLGIMGTVVGMVTALSTFAVASSRGGAPDLDIGRIIGSMFLAFISTGIALILSVTTRGYAEQVSAEQSEMLSELEGYSFTHLAPYLLPKNDNIIQQRFHELVDRQQSLMSESLEKSSATLTKFSSTIEGAQKLTSQLSDTMTQNASAVSQWGQRVTTDLAMVSGDVSSKLLDALNIINKELTQHRGGIEGSFKDARVILEEEKRLSLQQTEALQRRYAETVKQLNENNLALVRSFNAMATHYATHTEQQTASLEALRKEVAQLSERLVVSQERYQQTFLQTVQEYIRTQFDELTRSVGLGRRR
jgi:biopolymer transport protein ExbB/TolQ